MKTYFLQNVIPRHKLKENCGKSTNTNVMVFSLTRLVLEPTIYLKLVLSILYLIIN